MVVQEVVKRITDLFGNWTRRFDFEVFILQDGKFELRTRPSMASRERIASFICCLDSVNEDESTLYVESWTKGEGSFTLKLRSVDMRAVVKAIKQAKAK